MCLWLHKLCYLYDMKNCFRLFSYLLGVDFFVAQLKETKSVKTSTLVLNNSN